MKCKQNLCSRTKNLLSSGNCNVCQEAIKKATDEKTKPSKDAKNKKVELDFKILVDTHSKIAQGVKVDPDVVNTLLLGGIINILSQHDNLEELERKLESLEHENRTNKLRIDSLGNWVVKQSEVIKYLEAKVNALDETQPNVDTLNQRVIDLEAKSVEQILRKPKPTKKCDECGEIFHENCELEEHMDKHETSKMYKCGACEKSFHLK